ncbi:hypothetical protein BV25DRAFT_1829977 [Artomyces pyxidatus]|uniref:Uncharacterized protein n=1 Tax=Artomyces pyxidatus TaxID=48021 RepID=A0ACB8SQ23_9AGAM|nr:hypothetical protein BV25DRAFT_1829977 [Artomyces pyxidatus]
MQRSAAAQPAPPLTSEALEAFYSTRRADLLGRQIFNVEHVFRRLKVDAVPAELVANCLASFSVVNQTHICALKLLEKRADSISPNALDYLPDDPEGHRIVQALADVEEERMYQHLILIFKYITNFDSKSGTELPNDERREFKHENSSALLSDNAFILQGHPEAVPDFCLVPAGMRSNFWRDRLAFAEIKPTKKHGPQPNDLESDTVKDLCVEAAEYARLHMSSRPFQLFSIGLLICGSDFYVGIFDRAGVTYSPCYNMWDAENKGMETFIRVVLSMSRLLSAYDLGMDPTVRLAPRTFPTFNGYPSAYIVDRVPDDGEQRSWCTIGPPLFTALPLFGSGSLVWLVKACNDEGVYGSEMVLKSNWRLRLQVGESLIHRAIAYPTAERSYPGLAKFVTGGDVYIFNDKADHIDPLMTIAYLRGGDTLALENSPILHRVITESVGRPLWEFKSYSELLRALIAALKGHKFLFDQGMLHRDVSAGNILIAKDAASAPPGCEGFINDIEFVTIPENVEIRTKEKVAPVPLWGTGARALGLMTPETERSRVSFPQTSETAIMGTLQFKAVDVLEAAERNQQFSQNVAGDLESIVWTLSYCVMRYVMEKVKDETERETMTKIFQTTFGHLALSSIITSRRSLEPITWISTLEIAEPSRDEVLPEPMIILFEKLALKMLEKDTQSIRQSLEDHERILLLRESKLPPPGVDISSEPEPESTLAYEILFEYFETALDQMVEWEEGEWLDGDAKEITSLLDI